MIEKILIPNDTNVNLTFKIPKNLVGKKLKVYIDFEKEDSENNNEIPQWQKEEVLNRIKLNHKTVDAFEMIDNLDD